ncbi:MAG: SAM-dependent methyltransferase [Gammaproteobacteria bacterium]|nr:SAM-dependent methyltransferase [Gammaproteobacteria bacterium]
MSSYHPGIELPVPDAEQIEHSSCLIEKIIQRISSAGGVISFHDYMKSCLYEAGLGYYVAGSTKFGASGDFVTAPEISALFGQSLANQIADLFEQGLGRNILEFGAGTGKLCVDIVLRLNELGIDWDSYQVLEPSSDLQQRQQRFLQSQLCADDVDKIHWLSELPEGFDGLVLANEVLDAMPVNVVVKNEGWLELGVTFSNQKFEWVEFSRNSEAVQRMLKIDSHNDLPENYCTEVNLNYLPWFNSLMQSCNNAVLLLIDYGYEQTQYYHQQRTTGTLLCFYRHRVHPDPFVYPGLQDITSFVDFDAVAIAAEKAGFNITGLTTQANFLLANGLLDLVSDDSADEIQRLELAQQIKTLTLPGEMGEKFKVIGLQKNLQLDLNGI